MLVLMQGSPTHISPMYVRVYQPLNGRIQIPVRRHQCIPRPLLVKLHRHQLRQTRRRGIQAHLASWQHS